jgi:hypothetical protein
MIADCDIATEEHRDERKLDRPMTKMITGTL